MQIPILSSQKFYVYEHIRADTGAVFYVGKGKGRRAYVCSKHNRSQYWRRVAEKAGGLVVRFSARELDEELAFLAECERIDQLRRIGVSLCNMTDGGDGASGAVRSPEWCAKMGATHRGKTVPPDVREKISASVKACGYKPDAVARKKISMAHLGHSRNIGRVHPEAERLKRAASLIGNKSRSGQKRSNEERAKQPLAMKGRPQKLMTCPHCEKTGGNAMKRFHFDHCKAKK